MKILVLSLFASALFSFSSHCVAPNNLVIHGYAPKMKDGTELQLREVNLFDSKQPLNSYKMIVRNGEFETSIHTGNGDSFTLLKGNEGVSLFLDPGQLTIKFPDTTLSKITFTGNFSDQEFKLYLKDLSSQPISQRTIEIQEKYLWHRTDEIIIKYDSAKAAYDQYRIKFALKRIQEKPGSYINSVLLCTIMNLIPKEQCKASLSRLNKEAQNNNYGKFIKYSLDSLTVNSLLPSFVLPDTSGKMINLKDFAGKYVLIDFWASWCIPCREENPNLVAAYKKYGAKNFTILSISIDEKIEPWVKAVKEDKLAWTQVSDIDMLVYRKYNLKAVPFNFLIGPRGEILAKNLRGDNLMKTLEKVIE